MKKTQILTLALLISCASYKIYGSDAAPAGDGQGGVHVSSSSRQSEATREDAFTQLYKPTMKGLEAVDPRIIQLVDRVGRLQHEASQEDILQIRAYYFGKFFEYMEGLRKANQAPTAEFVDLWENIHAEAESEASKKDLGDINWEKLEVIFIRGLLLASDGRVSDAAKDLLGKIPGMELFFAAQEPTPLRLVRFGEARIPAWKHSAAACIQSEYDMDKVEKPYLIAHPLHHTIIKRVVKEANRLGLRKNVFLPMPNLGKIGITAILEMLLHDAYPLPLTHEEYTAHGLSLVTAEAAAHDKAHGTVDNRRFEVLQAALNLLRNTPEGNITDENIELATRIAVERYQAFNDLLKHYLQVKKEIFVRDASSEVAVSIAPAMDGSVAVDVAVGGPAAKLRARQEYNAGVSPLFEALHEKYAFKANVLEKTTFAEAITQLCANATAHSEVLRFNEFNTLFNPQSDLTDAEIIAAVRNMPVSRTGVYIPAPVVVGDAAVAVAVQTIGQYPRFDLAHATVRRGDVYTEITFNDKNTGEHVTLKSATAKYLFETAKDQNALLRLIGREVKVPVVNPDLPEAEGRIAYQAAVTEWFTEVSIRTNAMINGLVAEMQQPGMAGAIAAYDDLITRQNAAWAARFAPAVAVDSSAAAAAAAAAPLESAASSASAERVFTQEYTQEYYEAKDGKQ